MSLSNQVTPSHLNVSLRVGTYNILNPFHAVKWSTAEGLDEQGVDNWLTGRRQAIFDNLSQAALDLCALQEVSARTYPELSKAQLNHQEISLSQLYTHFTSDEEGAHGVAVLYNHHRFELIRDVRLRTPAEEYRSAACVDLKDREYGGIYRIVSVHLKGYNPYETNIDLKRESQKRGDRELASYLPHILDGSDRIDGIFIMGDFNEDAQEMRARGSTSRQGQLIAEAFHWSGVEEVTEKRTGRQIDWIFYRPCSGTHQADLKSIQLSQNYSASDHALTAMCMTRSTADEQASVE